MNNKFIATAVIFSAVLSSINTVEAKSFKRPNEKKLYVGSNSTEARMEFTGIVEVNSTKTLTQAELRELAEEQVEHTIGPMSAAKYTAVPKGDHILSNLKVIAKKGSLQQISYDYEGNIVLENGPKATYDIILAKNPKKVYDASIKTQHFLILSIIIFQIKMATFPFTFFSEWMTMPKEEIL
jgi:hypothetical protein